MKEEKRKIENLLLSLRQRRVLQGDPMHAPHENEKKSRPLHGRVMIVAETESRQNEKTKRVARLSFRLSTVLAFLVTEHLLLFVIISSSPSHVSRSRLALAWSSFSLGMHTWPASKPLKQVQESGNKDDATPLVAPMRSASHAAAHLPQPHPPHSPQVSYKFLAFLLRSSFLRFLSLCLFIFDRRFFNVLENRAKTPPNTPPNHDGEDDDEGRRRLLLLLLPVGGANAVHVVAVSLLLDARQEAEEGKSVADEVKARWLVKGKGRQMTVEEATRLHSVWRALAMSLLWRGERERLVSI